MPAALEDGVIAITLFGSTPAAGSDRRQDELATGASSTHDQENVRPEVAPDTPSYVLVVASSVNGLPLAGVAVWFAVDGGGAQIVWSGHTDALGVARDAYGALPRLDPGTYYVFRSRPGYVFRNPDTEIINE